VSTVFPVSGQPCQAHQPSDINVVLFIGLYFGYKFIKKTKIRRWDERDFVTGIPTNEETEIPEVPPRNVWEKIASVIF
jgi:yeast amino acid transporter